jgi:integrative and conjugative element protein (TIGR02256 family)
MPHPRATDLSFRSVDGRFGLILPASVLARLLRACHRAGEGETGGILVGYYTAELDRAVVTAASLAPRDSCAGPTWFERGVRGLQGWLQRAWRAKGHFYLGEWHYHPHASATPSPIDIRQMAELALSPALRCPEPLLLIVGGHPSVAWCARSFVFPRGVQPIELLPVGPPRDRRVDEAEIDGSGRCLLPARTNRTVVEL